MSGLGCYGVSPDKATEDWMCSRCTENALEEVKFLLRLQMEPGMSGNLVIKFISTVLLIWDYFVLSCG